VCPYCAQASQAGGDDTQRYAAPLTNLVCGVDLGALLHQTPDSVHNAIVSCIMERRVSILRTSQSSRRQLHATLCTPNTHAVCCFVHLFLVHLFQCLCLAATLFLATHSCSAQASAQGPGASLSPHDCAREARRFPRPRGVTLDTRKNHGPRCAPPTSRAACGCLTGFSPAHVPARCVLCTSVVVAPCL
jgi:hypothetical protein